MTKNDCIKQETMDASEIFVLNRNIACTVFMLKNIKETMTEEKGV